jgi:hypothetical protein
MPVRFDSGRRFPARGASAMSLMIPSMALTLGRFGETSQAAIAFVQQMMSLASILSLPNPTSCV